MTTSFTKNIGPSVQRELAQAQTARQQGLPAHEFQHLERAHVLGQASTYWHVWVHIRMLAWGLRQTDAREVFGQVFRVVGATTKTAIGLVPHGNTGGARVSPFRRMPISEDLAQCIDRAKSNA